MIWISQHFIRVLGGARGLPGWHFLASPPSLQSLHTHPSGTLFPCPHCRLGNKAHCFSPLYACASPRAAPACCACALLLKLGWRGRERGRGIGERPPGTFCNRPRACIFLIPSLPFLRFLIPPPTPPPFFFFYSYIVSHAPDWITGNFYSPCRRVLSQMNFKPPSVHIVWFWFTLLLISLYYFVLTPLPTTKNIWLVVKVVFQNSCWSSQQ